MVQRWNAAPEEWRQGGMWECWSDLRKNTWAFVWGKNYINRRCLSCVSEMYECKCWWKKCEKKPRHCTEIGGKIYYLEMLKNLEKSAIDIQSNNTLVKSGANPYYCQSLFEVQLVKYSFLRYMYSKTATTGSCQVWWVCVFCSSQATGIGCMPLKAFFTTWLMVILCGTELE